MTAPKCFFCGQQTAPLELDLQEFDCWFHRSCVGRELRERGPRAEEARLIAECYFTRAEIRALRR